MLKRAALVFLFLVAALLATGYALLRLSLPAVDGEIALAGLAAPVSAERDAQGVPTVRGANRLDVARVTGFLHAQDRYFQMDLLRRQAAGELSGLFGSRALELDRRQRLHRMRSLAERTLRGLPGSEQALIAAYTAGVNAGLARLAVRPPEYLLLRAAPQPWRPEDTVLAVHAMFFQLADAPRRVRGPQRRAARLRAGAGGGVRPRQRRRLGGPGGRRQPGAGAAPRRGDIRPAPPCESRLRARPLVRGNSGEPIRIFRQAATAGPWRAAARATAARSSRTTCT